MPRVSWPLLLDRPRIQVQLALAADGQQVIRNLIADTGAANNRAPFDLIMEEHDCIVCGGVPSSSATLGGAISGTFPVYNVRIQIPRITYDHIVRIVGVPSAPAGFDGIACFRFLNRFTYGNFGNPNQFGLEC
jgi:hypothetical protein